MFNFFYRCYVILVSNPFKFNKVQTKQIHWNTKLSFIKLEHNSYKKVSYINIVCLKQIHKKENKNTSLVASGAIFEQVYNNNDMKVKYIIQISKKPKCMNAKNENLGTNNNQSTTPKYSISQLPLFLQT